VLRRKKLYGVRVSDVVADCAPGSLATLLGPACPLQLALRTAAGPLATWRHGWQFVTDRMLLDERICLRTRTEGQSLVHIAPSSSREPDDSFIDTRHAPFEYGKVPIIVALYPESPVFVA
jgi:hypothetical protein